MMELGDLRVLLSIVQHGSFLAAAHALGVPRTTLRRQIERLEAEVGVALLRREGRGVCLTYAGERVVQRAGPLLSEATRMIAEAQTEDNLGILRMIVPVGVPDSIRVQALLSLQTMGTGLSIHVTESDSPLTLLREPFDILIHYGSPPPVDGWFSRCFYSLSVQLLAAPGYLARAGVPERVEDLAEHTLLAWSAGTDLEDAWPLHDGGTIRIAPAVSSANTSMLTAFTLAEGGIALLPIAPDIFPGSEALVPVLPGVVGGRRDLRILMRQPSRMDPRLRVILGNIERLLAVLQASP